MSNEGPIIPFHSRVGKTCHDCGHWRSKGKDKFAFGATPAGYALTKVSDLENEGRLPEKAIQYTMSFCTATPTWAFVHSTHYCGQWKTNVEYMKAEI